MEAEGRGHVGWGLSCSIRISNTRLGITIPEVRNFVYSKMASADGFSQLSLMNIERQFRLIGFAIELNEDGERAHIYFYTPAGKGVATLFRGRLEVPPEAWLKPPGWTRN